MKKEIEQIFTGPKKPKNWERIGRKDGHSEEKIKEFIKMDEENFKRYQYAKINYPVNRKSDLQEINKLKGVEIIAEIRDCYSWQPSWDIDIDANTTKEQIKLFLESLPLNFEIGFSDYSKDIDFIANIKGPVWKFFYEYNGKNSSGCVVVYVQAYGEKYLIGRREMGGQWEEINKIDLIEFIYKKRMLPAGRNWSKWTKRKVQELSRFAICRIFITAKKGEYLH